MTFEPNKSDDLQFDDFLASIEKLAEELGVPVSYVEDEFVIDGELVY